MSDGPPISSKVGLDTSEFKAKLNDLNRDMRVIESGFKAVAAGMGDWEDSSAGLEERIRALTGLIETQKEKVGLLERQYKDVAEAQGADSRAAEELEIKLNKERQRLGELQTELGGSKTKLEELQNPTQVTGEKMQDLETKTGGARDGLDKLKGVADTLKAGLAVGVAAIAGLALAVVGVSKAVTDLVLDSSKAAGELVDLSNKTGISTTRLQELSYVGDQVGTSADTMTGSFGRLARSLSTAREEQQEYDDQLASGKMEDEITLPVKMAAAFNQLGVLVYRRQRSAARPGGGIRGADHGAGENPERDRAGRAGHANLWQVGDGTEPADRGGGGRDRQAEPGSAQDGGGGGGGYGQGAGDVRR